MKTLRSVPLAAVALVLVATVAWAHDLTYATELTIRASDTSVSPGQEIRIAGHVRSPKDRCEARAKVRLVQEGGGVVARTRTDRSGRYTFTVRPHTTADWHTRLARRVLTSTDRHHHVCANATSKSLTIRVR